MAKIIKVEVYFIDCNDQYDTEEFKNELELASDDLGMDLEFKRVETSREFEWNDDLRINRSNRTIKELQEYFK